MLRCESCGVEIDDMTSLVHHHRCKKCNNERMDDYWAESLHEMQANGIGRTGKAEIEFVYHLFDPSDAEDLAQKVTALGHQASVEHTRNKIVEVWVVRCLARVVPSRENIEPLRDMFCDLADDYENWFVGWGVLRRERKNDPNARSDGG